MDNISHSLAGLAVGVLIDKSLPPEPRPADATVRRRMLLTAAWLGANFPDLDLLLIRLLPAPLGYLLHHRGHTHTVVFALIQVMALMGLIWLLWPSARRLLAHSKAARHGLLAASAIGLATHLLLDYLNSYGLHPFWPFSGAWLYGDMIFILEPVFWVSFGLPLLFLWPGRWPLAAGLGGLAAFIAWAMFRAYLHWASAAMLMGLALVLAAATRSKSGSRRGVVAGISAALLFIAVQGAASHYGKQMLAARLASIDPAGQLLDAALTAFPSNPACWNFATIERAGDSYRLRRGILSLLPGSLPPDACPASLNMALEPRGGIGLGWEASVPLARLREHASDCHFAAWLRFARLPYVDGEAAIDARFSNKGGNFTRFEFARHAGKPCPTGIPEWDMPRGDLLQGTAAKAGTQHQ